MKPWIVLACTALLAMPGLASAQNWSEMFKAANDYRVIVSPVEGADMQVFPQPPANGRDYFCAAADYAVRFLGTSATDRLVIVVPEMPRESASDRKSVHFALVPRSDTRDLPTGQGSIDPRRAGENRNVSGAHQFCFRSSRKGNL